jgi:tetratricopeptide (TPR) repeat protein
MQNRLLFSSAAIGWLVPLILVASTLAAFLPVLTNEFVNWDDPQNLLGNFGFRGLGWDKLAWMFTTFHMSLYRPLVWMTFGLDYLLWGLDPVGYHLTSLLIHAVNAVFFYFLTLWLLSLAFVRPSESVAVRLAAGLGALAFAIHPLRVEAVAWASARSEILSGLFFLTALLCYLRYVTGRESRFAGWWLVASLSSHGLSLLSKASGITLPIVLLVLDVYPLQRLPVRALAQPAKLSQRVWCEKLPFLFVSAAVAFIAFRAKEESGAMWSLGQYDLISRVVQSFYGIAFYVWKTLFPLKLSPLYELPAHFDPWSRSYLCGSALVVIVTIVLIFTRQRWPGGLASWVCYIATLMPVLGIAQSGPQLTADRYSYVPCLGLGVLVAAAFFYCWRLRVSGHVRLLTFIFVNAFALLFSLAMLILTRQQVDVWRDSKNLWMHVLSVSPSKIAHNNLANFFVAEGQTDLAMKHYIQALRLDPDYVPAYNNLGLIFAGRGEWELAMRYYREALRIQPAYEETHVHLGTALLNQGEIEAAIHHYNIAWWLNPGNPRVHNNLGLALMRQGDLGSAVRHFRRALALSKAEGSAHLIHFNLGLVLSKQGFFEQAIFHFQQALLIRPDFVEARDSLVRMLTGERERSR